MTADLSSQSSIRTAAAGIRARYPHLHVLINNAGIITRRRELSVDGIEMQFAVNHLAYFSLTLLLLDQLKAGAPSRVINVTSGAHSGATIDFDDLTAGAALRSEPGVCSIQAGQYPVHLRACPPARLGAGLP